jgi:hypothetical protein
MTRQPDLFPEYRTFALTLRADSRSDVIRPLRAFLKIAARSFGLRAVDVRETTPTKTFGTPPALGASDVQINQRLRMIQMDMREFRKPRFIKVENSRTPRQLRIAGVVMGKFSKPDLIFENGDRLGLSATNIETLSDGYGFDSENWAGHVVEAYVGQGSFEGETVDMVLLKPLSQAEDSEQAAAEPPVRKTPDKPVQVKQAEAGLDDEIPF